MLILECPYCGVKAEETELSPGYEAHLKRYGPGSSDEEFEAFLLEVLSDFQITIPELGTIKARRRPAVILTSNRTREIHDAVKRRCFYHWVDYPDAQRELEILRRKAPKAAAALSKEVVAFVQRLRGGQLLGRGLFQIGSAGLELLDRGFGGAARVLARDQEVAGIAVLDLDDLAEVAEVHNFFEQNDLHVVGSLRCGVGRCTATWPGSARA